MSNEDKSYNAAIQASLQDFESTNESDFFPINETVREGGRSAANPLLVFRSDLWLDLLR